MPEQITSQSLSSSSKLNRGHDPEQAFCTSGPLEGHKGLCFLKPIVDHPMIDIGEYTYYDDPNGPEHFVDKCVRYHYDFAGDRLVIGRFCAIATGVQFIMNGANHLLDGFSTYPFAAFHEDWAMPDLKWPDHGRGDTVIGHDVWIGREATIMPGVTIGNGAIIGTKALVIKDVAPYTIVGGNPAQTLKSRFDETTIARLEAIAWWHWSAEKLTRHLDAIRQLDMDVLEQAASL
ncbi:MAG: CatB-related O-acetyltransferase [Rhizobiales bacterium]|nr:CatB-related O-acetyltransferase [Hyphomicrobiales bacterium]